MMQRLSENLYVFEDTCNVYVIRDGASAILVDFGAGDVMEHLSELGVDRVIGVLMTHHHRDQGQGLPRAAAAGIRIWVPHTEQDLFRDVEAHWQSRDLFNSYNNRQDRFSLLVPVSIAGTLRDYDTLSLGAYRFTVVPTPGHTVGSVTLLCNVDDRRVAFTGDLIYAAGKTRSLAALQWGYNDACGVPASVASLIDLRERDPELLLPSHGEPMDDPGAAIDLLVERLRALLDLRGDNPRLFQWRAQPYQQITRHVLWNRTSTAYNYVLLSESGKALFIDFGYDFMTGMAAGTDRASRRPWLYTLPALKRDFGVTKVDVVIPTHYHDDHVAGCNLLRRVEGTEVWAAANFADVLARPYRYDLSCLWYDPIPVDRVLPLESTVGWEEYEIGVYPLPGHTFYAAAISFEADGLRFLASGDQYQEGYKWNYVYHNGFEPGDYTAGAELFRRLSPDMILTGHWEPRPVQPTYLDRLQERAAQLESLHRELLPETECEGMPPILNVHIRPYQISVCAGEPVELEVEVTNLAAEAVELALRMIAPDGWQIDQPDRGLQLPARTIGIVRCRATPPPALSARRVRLAVDLVANGHRLGQRGEALVSVTGQV